MNPSPKLRVGYVEVVDGDPPILFDERVMGSRTWSAALDGAVVGGKDGLELLGDTDGHHTWSAGLLEIGSDDLNLAVVLLEMQHWDSMLLGKELTEPTWEVAGAAWNRL